MDGNKDEALRCVRIAEEAIRTGNKDRAIKFIKIAQRLNHNLSVDSLLQQCQTLDSQSSSAGNSSTTTSIGAKTTTSKTVNKGLNGERNYTPENVQLIREIKEPDYSLHKNYSYQIPKTTEEYGVQFFVKSQAFDANYPPGSPARATVEDNVIKDYKNMLHRYCQIEMQRRTWNRNLPIHHCEKLKSFGVASA